MEWIGVGLAWGLLALLGVSLCRVASQRDPLVWSPELKRRAFAAKQAAEELNFVVSPAGRPFFPTVRARAQLTALLTDLEVAPKPKVVASLRGGVRVEGSYSESSTASRASRSV